MDNSRHPAGGENSVDTNAAFNFFTRKNIKDILSKRNIRAFIMRKFLTYIYTIYNIRIFKNELIWYSRTFLLVVHQLFSFIFRIKLKLSCIMKL